MTLILKLFKEDGAAHNPRTCHPYPKIAQCTSPTPAEVDLWFPDNSASSIKHYESTNDSGSSASKIDTQTYTKGTVYDHFVAAFSSDPLTADVTITGTISVALALTEENTRLNAYPRIYVYVWKGDNSGVRGVLYGPTTSGVECPTTPYDLQTMFFDAVTVSDVDAKIGDSIVLEIYTVESPAANATYYLSLYYGTTALAYLSLSSLGGLSTDYDLIPMRPKGWNTVSSSYEGGNPYEYDKQSLAVTAPVSGWPKLTISGAGGLAVKLIENAVSGFHGVVDNFLSTRGSKWKRYVTHGLSVNEKNDLANYYRLKKKIRMTFKNTATGASRGRESVTLGTDNAGTVQRLKKRFTMRFTDKNAGRPQQGIKVVAPVSGWPKFTPSKWKRQIVHALSVTSPASGWPKLTGKWKRFVQQGVSITEANVGSVSRLKKKLVMTFKNTATGASRGRQGITVTAPTTGRPRLIERFYRVVSQNAKVGDTPKKKLVMRKQQGISVIAPSVGWAKVRSFFRRTISQALKVTAPVSGWPIIIKTGAFSYTVSLIENAVTGFHGVVASYFSRASFKRNVEQNIKVSPLLVTKRLVRKLFESLKVTGNLKNKLKMKVSQSLKIIGSTKTVEVMRRQYSQGIKVVANYFSRERFKRSISQGFKITGTGAMKSRIIRAFAQGIKATAQIQLRESFRRKLTEPFKVAGVVRWVQKQVRAYSQGVKVATTYLARATFRRSLTQALKVTGVVRWFQKHTRTYAQAVKVIGNLSEKTRFRRSLSQSLKVSAVLLMAGRLNMVITQALKVADTIRWVQKQVRTYSQGIRASDNTRRSFQKRFAQGLKTTDNLRKRFSTKLYGAISVTDRLKQSFRKKLGQGAKVTDTVSRRVTRIQALVQGLKVTVVQSWKQTMVRAYSQGIKATATFRALGKSLWISLRQSILISHLPALPPLVLSLIQNLGITDYYKTSTRMLRRYSQNIDVTDSIRKFDVKTFIQTLKVLDIRSLRLHRVVAQSLLVSDAIRWAQRQVRTISQGITITLVMGRTSRLLRSLSQSIKISTVLTTQSKWRRHLAQGIAVTGVLSLTSKLRVLLSQAVKIATINLSRANMVRKIGQSIRLGADVKWIQKQLMTIAQSVKIATAIGLRSTWRRNLSQTIRIVATPNFLKVSVLRLIQNLNTSVLFSKRFKKPFSQGITVASTLSLTSRLRLLLAQSIKMVATIGLRTKWLRSLSQGIRVTGTFKKFGIVTLQLAQGLNASVLFFKRFRKPVSQGISITDALSRRTKYASTLVQGLKVVALTRTASKLIRFFSQGMKVAGTVAGRSLFITKLQQAIRVLASLNLRTKFVLKLANGIRVATGVLFTGKFYRKMAESIRLTAVGSIIKTGIQKVLLTEALQIQAQTRKLIQIILNQGIRISHWLPGYLAIQLAQAIKVSANYISKGAIPLLLSEAVRVSDFIIKFISMPLEDGITIRDTVLKNPLASLSEHINLTCDITKGLARRIADGFVISASPRLARLQHIIVAQAIIIATSASRLFTGAIRLFESVKVTETFGRVHRALRRLREQLTFSLDIDISTIVPAVIEIEAGWLGSFPRPTGFASITIEVSKYIDAIASPMAGLAVTAEVYNSVTGSLWKTLDLPETSLPGVYRSDYFRITRYDPTGSYPVNVTARRGVLTRANISGWLVVYTGTPRGISFH